MATPPDSQTVEHPGTDTQAAPSSPFERLGGRPAIAAIVNRFYDLMETDPAYAGLRAMHAPDITPMRSSLTGFLTGWSGGPRDWSEANPGRCMMSVHKPFVITEELAGQWVDCIKRAIADAGPDDPQLCDAMAGVLEQMARGMAQ